MKIFVKIPSGKSISLSLIINLRPDIPLNVDESDTIEIIKAKVRAKEKLPSTQLILIFAGNQLRDGSNPSPTHWFGS